MLFGSLFSSYVLLRTGRRRWPDQSAMLSVPLATLNTLILISSSVTMVLAWAALKRRQSARVPRLMGLTILGGALFLVVKAFEYGDKFSHGLFPSTSNFLGLYFTLTGLHAMHVIGGMVVNAYLWGPGTRMWRRPATLHEPDRGRRPLLALRRRGLDLPVPGAVSVDDAMTCHWIRDDR